MDWFGVITCDLHGPWDVGVLAIGKVILGVGFLSVKDASQ